MKRTSIASMFQVSVGQWRIPSAGTMTNMGSAHLTQATSVLRSAMQAGGSTSVSMPTLMEFTTRYAWHSNIYSRYISAWSVVILDLNI